MPGEIEARLGAAWIDASYVRQFLAEILAGPHYPGRASRRAGLDRPRQPGHRAGHLHLGHRPLPGPGPRPGVLEQRRIEVRDKIGGRRGS